MTNTSIGLIKGRNTFLDFSPGLVQLVKLRWLRRTIHAVAVGRKSYEVLKGTKGITDVLGSTIANSLLRTTTNRFRTLTISAHRAATINNVGLSLRGLGATRRIPVGPMHTDSKGRVVKEIRIMYHEANRAGKHLDIHIGSQSLVMRIDGKHVATTLSYGKDGKLTERAKRSLIQHVKREITNNSRVVHNHDHTVTNARCSWLDPIKEGYGSGKTRQTVLVDKAELYHPQLETSQHWYIPSLFPNQGTYIHKIYPGSKTTAPILIWGKLIPRDVKFEDRLHLKMIQPEDITKYISTIDPSTNTRKYDGASAYFTTNGIGFKFFSPRYSKDTGHRIEYTYKVPEFCFPPNYWSRGLHSRISQATGMGELLFWKRTTSGKILHAMFNIRGPENWCWNYIPAASIGGILNGHSVRSRSIMPELRIYRIDSLNGTRTINLPFHENRILQTRVASSNNVNVKVVALSSTKRRTDWEGFVGVPYNSSIISGLKIKWWGDTNDWRVIANELSLSPKGNIQGTLRFRSLESGREFKLGPGSIGSFDENMRLLDMSQTAQDLVAKVQSRNGHEGRAAKLVEWHLCKGIGI
jgi:hypothetical protein